jgi:parallel beta-helix repeat protein
MLVLLAAAGSSHATATAAPTLAASVPPLRFEVWPSPPPAGTADRGATVVVGLGELVPAMRRLRLRHGLALPVEVVLRGGTYRLDEPLRLEALDSGSESAPLVIRAAEGETPFLSGARPVEGWRRPRRDEIPARLPAAARSQVLIASAPVTASADLGELGQRGFGRARRLGHAFLVAGERPLPIARWPDSGYLAISAVPDGKQGRRLSFTEPPPPGIEREPDLWVFGYWHEAWAGEHQPATLDAETRTITLRGDAPAYGILARERAFYVENALAALDRPGEWWIDRATSRIWLWPDRQGTAPVALVVTPTLLELVGARHIRLEGLALSGARGNAVVLRDVEDVVLRDCEIHAAGGLAAIVQGRHSGLERCDLREIADSAVLLSGGDRWTLARGGLFVIDSEIARYGQWVRTYTAAVELQGVGHRVAGNRIHDAPHMGIYLFGNDHVIERNILDDLAQDTDDVGAIYQYRDWTARGTLIRDNIICRLRPVIGKAMAIYLDAFSSGATVTGNRIMGVPYGILLNGGSDNLIADNLIVGGTAPLWLDASGLQWLRRHFDRPSAPLRQLLDSVPYQGDEYAQRYPGLPSVLDGDPGMPKRNVVTGNRVVGDSLGWIDERLVGWSLIRENALVATPSAADLAVFPPECHRR